MAGGEEEEEGGTYGVKLVTKRGEGLGIGNKHTFSSHGDGGSGLGGLVSSGMRGGDENEEDEIEDRKGRRRE